jgi:hypothetical protein
VSIGCIRRRGDLAARVAAEEAAQADRTRSVSWWSFEDGRFGLEAYLPAAEGAVVARALSRLADRLPRMPGEDDRSSVGARRADALVALCSAGLAADPDPDRATVVVHATLDGFIEERGGCELEGGPVIHPSTARRLACTARVQTVAEDPHGQAVGVGRLSRDPSAAMVRQLRYRDFGCVFPGCGTRAFTQAHHIVWWDRGGRTDLDNLVLVCFFHHKLVHEYAWRIERDRIGVVRWFKPEGSRHRAGPAPPVLAVAAV